MVIICHFEFWRLKIFTFDSHSLRFCVFTHNFAKITQFAADRVMAENRYVSNMAPICRLGFKILNFGGRISVNILIYFSIQNFINMTMLKYCDIMAVIHGLYIALKWIFTLIGLVFSYKPHAWLAGVKLGRSPPEPSSYTYHLGSAACSKSSTTSKQSSGT